MRIVNATVWAIVLLLITAPAFLISATAGGVKVITIIEFDEATKAIIKEATSDINTKNLVIIFNTHGGAVYVGMDIATSIRTSVAPVTCVVSNKAMSIGLYALQACETRLSSNTGVFMGHQPFISHLPRGGRIKDLESEARALTVLNTVMATFITRRSTMTPAEYMAKIDGGDLTIGAEDALRLKLIDRIISEDELIKILAGEKI